MLWLQEQSIRVNCTTLPVAPSKYLYAAWAAELLLASGLTVVGSSAICLHMSTHASCKTMLDTYCHLLCSSLPVCMCRMLPALGLLR